MKMRAFLAPMLGLTLGASIALAPLSAEAQTRQQLERRQQMKNQWRNVALAGGVVGVYGLIKGDKTLAAVGLGTAAYAGTRYEADRKSQRRLEDSRYGYRYDSRYDSRYRNRYDYAYSDRYDSNRYYATSKKSKKSKKSKNVPRGKAYGYWKKR